MTMLGRFLWRFAHFVEWFAFNRNPDDLISEWIDEELIASEGGGVRRFMD